MTTKVKITHEGPGGSLYLSGSVSGILFNGESIEGHVYDGGVQISEKPLSRSPARAAAYLAFDSERAYQEAQEGNSLRTGVSKGKQLTVGEIIAVSQKILNDALNEWYKPGGQVTALPYIRKLGGMATQALEVFGAPHREGF